MCFILQFSVTVLTSNSTTDLSDLENIEVRRREESEHFDCDLLISSDFRFSGKLIGARFVLLEGNFSLDEKHMSEELGMVTISSIVENGNQFILLQQVNLLFSF